MDAAELVEVDYEPLDPVIQMEDALAADSSPQFEAIGSNVIIGLRSGSDDPLAGSDVIVRGRFENQRVAVVPMEGSAIAVDPTGTDYDLTVHISCQMPHMVRGVLSGLLGVAPERMRVIAPNVGGSFGAKHLSAEGVVIAKLALELGRPIKWVETRSENMVALSHGRGQVQYVELGLKRDGTMVGMRCRMIGDAGAMPVSVGSSCSAKPKLWRRVCITYPQSPSTWALLPPTPPRWERTEVRGDPRPQPSWNGLSIWPLTNSGLTPSNFGARTSFSPTSSH